MAKERSGTEGCTGSGMKAPHGVEYQWIDMLIYGVLMMTYRLMAMDVDNEGVWRAPSTKQVGLHTGWWNPAHVEPRYIGYAMASIVVVMHAY